MTKGNPKQHIYVCQTRLARYKISGPELPETAAKFKDISESYLRTGDAKNTDE